MPNTELDKNICSCLFFLKKALILDNASFYTIPTQVQNMKYDQFNIVSNKCMFWQGQQFFSHCKL